MVSQATASDTLRLLRCSVAGTTYGLDTTWVEGIQRTERFRPAPGPDGVVGRLGDLPVYSLAQQLGPDPPTPGTTQQILVLDTGAGPWGLLVDRATPLPPVAARAVVPVPPLATEAATDFWLGAVRLEQEILLIVDAERLHPEARVPRPWRERAQSVGASCPALTSASPPSRGTRQLVLFATTATPPGKRPVVFGLSLAQVAEICEPLPVLSVPGAPADVAGLVSWREHLVPVVDLACRLGLPPMLPDGRMRLLIARTPGATALAGFLVRQGIRVLRLPLTSLPCSRALPIDPARVRGMVELEKETVIIPDLGRLE